MPTYRVRAGRSSASPVDQAGRIVYRHTGALEAARLQDLLAEHFGVGPLDRRLR